MNATVAMAGGKIARMFSARPTTTRTARAITAIAATASVVFVAAIVTNAPAIGVSTIGAVAKGSAV